MQSSWFTEQNVCRTSALPKYANPGPRTSFIVPLGMAHTPSRPPILYSVTASLPDEPTAQAYIGWLGNGHVEAVLKCGASRGWVVRVLPDDPTPRATQPVRVRSSYLFPSRDAYETYVREHAPALRADGLARFGPERGVTMVRELSEVLWPAMGGSSTPELPVGVLVH